LGRWYRVQVALPLGTRIYAWVRRTPGFTFAIFNDHTNIADDVRHGKFITLSETSTTTNIQDGFRTFQSDEFPVQTVSVYFLDSYVPVYFSRLYYRETQDSTYLLTNDAEYTMWSTSSGSQYPSTNFELFVYLESYDSNVRGSFVNFGYLAASLENSCQTQSKDTLNNPCWSPCSGSPPVPAVSCIHGSGTSDISITAVTSSIVVT
jgi:hypothetical protein